MLLSEVVQTFQQIATATGRLRVVTLLASLFRHAPDDAATLVYLLQGRLGPPYAAPNIGMDEQRIATAIAEAADLPIATIRRLAADQGDLGLVAEQLLPRQDGTLTVAQVYEQLLRIATMTGPGTTATKIALLRDLLRQTGAADARVLVRIVQGKLRLGVGDSTVMDAIAAACGGDGALRPRVERAYRVCADLGLVATTALGGGAEALDRLQPMPGRPVLSALAARVATAGEVIDRLGRAIVEPKYDGLRLQVHKDGERIWLFSRRLEDLTDAFPELTTAARRQIDHAQAILDGEAVGYDPTTGRLLPFQQTAQRRRMHGVADAAASVPMRYYAFDLLALDGEDVMVRPQRERSLQLRAVVRDEPNGALVVTPQIETDDAATLERFFAEMVGQGHEGVMAKRPDAPYRAGVRSFDWVKLKREYQTALADTFDVVIVGYFYGRGRRARLGVGSLLCAVYDPEGDRYRTVTRVGSGLTDAEWVSLKQALDTIRVPERPRQVDAQIVPDVWVAPVYVVEVIAAQVSRSPLHTCGRVGREPGYALRFPRILRIRDDRRPEDATTEAEVKDLYRGRATRSAQRAASAC